MPDNKPWWQRRRMSRQEGAERLRIATDVARGEISIDEAHRRLDGVEERYGIPTKRRFTTR